MASHRKSDSIFLIQMTKKGFVFIHPENVKNSGKLIREKEYHKRDVYIYEKAISLITYQSNKN